MKELFTQKQVSKFFGILARLNRASQKRYSKRDELSTRYGYCEQEIFVDRTIGKWLGGKCFLWTEEAETGFYQQDPHDNTSQIPIKQKQVRYIQLMKPRYALGYGHSIDVKFYDASRPSQLNNELQVTHNIALSIKANEITPAKFKSVLKLFIYQEPEVIKVEKNEDRII
jgi:hypothetical protein